MRGPLSFALLVLIIGCGTGDTENQLRTASWDSVQAAMLNRMADSAEVDLLRSGEPLRPLCIAYLEGDYKDPPGEMLSVIRVAERGVYPVSHCEGLTVDGQPAALLWISPRSPEQSIAGGYHLGGAWGRGFECTPVKWTENEEPLMDCQVIEHS
jgi:hypothetical protein